MTNIGTGWLHVDIPSEMWEATPTGSGVLYLLQQGADTITKLWHSCRLTLLLREVTLTHNRATCQALPCFIRRWHWPIKRATCQALPCIFKEVTFTHKELHVRPPRRRQWLPPCQALLSWSGTTLTCMPTLLIFGVAVDPQIGYHQQ